MNTIQTADDSKKYMEKWLELNTKMNEKGMTWASLEEDDEFHQYMSYDIKTFTSEEEVAINVATNKIGKILNKVYKKILSDKSLQSKLGLPIEAMDAVQISSELFSYFTRLDLIVNDGEIKLIEVNCDTPTGYLETHVANEVICEDAGLKSPNLLNFSIFRAWRMIEKEYGLLGKKIYFTSYGEHEEDKQTVLFNMKSSGVKGEYIAVEDITIDENGLYDTEGNLIEYLYRLYPLEFLPTDVDENGKKIGNLFLQHIASGKVKIINPPSAFMMQSKAVMAIVWEMYENEDNLFGDDELEDIYNYFLPTYFTDEHFKREGIAHVEKPIFGREGGGVKILSNNGEIIEKDEEDWYNEWHKVYQAYVEMPEMTVNTWDGEYTGKLLVGSFLIGGESSGLFLRVGEKITGNLSMFCGVAIKD